MAGSVLTLGLANQAYAVDRELCVKLEQFASAKFEHASSFIELRTFWGVREKGNQIILGEKSCQRDGSEAGKVMCDYLLPHSSTEFPEMNLRRILSCIQGHDPFAAGITTRLKDVEIDAYQSPLLPKNRSLHLSLKSQGDTNVMRLEVKDWPTEGEN